MRESRDSLQKKALQRLKIQAYGKLQLPHACAIFKSGNLSVVASLAIDTSCSAVIGTEGINRMIEDIEGVNAKLRAQAFFDREPF